MREELGDFWKTLEAQLSITGSNYPRIIIIVLIIQCILFYNIILIVRCFIDNGGRRMSVDALIPWLSLFLLASPDEPYGNWPSSGAVRGRLSPGFGYGMWYTYSSICLLLLSLSFEVIETGNGNQDHEISS